MKILLLVFSTITTVSAVTFEKLTLNHAGADHPATKVLSLDPLVMEAFEKIGDTFYYSRLIWGNNGANPHLILDTNLPPAPGEPTDSRDSFSSASGGGKFYAINTLKINDINMADAHSRQLKELSADSTGDWRVRLSLTM